MSKHEGKIYILKSDKRQKQTFEVTNEWEKETKSNGKVRSIMLITNTGVYIEELEDDFLKHYEEKRK